MVPSNPTGIRWRSVLLLLCLGLAACSPASPTARAAGSPLTVAIPAGRAAQALQAAAQQYAAAGGEPVRVEAITGDGYYDRVSAVLLSGQNNYDLLYLPADSLARWVQYHALRPITVEVDRQPLAAWLPSLTFSAEGTGALYALPAQPDPLVLWYRADLLQAAGLPEPTASLKAFRAAALALNAPPERYGAAIAGGDLDAGSDYAALLAGNSAQGNLLEVFTSAEQSPPARGALAFYAALRSPDGVTDPAADRFTRSDVLQALREGRAAMGFAPLSAAAELLDCTASPKVCASGSPLLAAARLPGERCAVLENLSAWAVPLHAANPDAAQRFAAWLVSTEGQRAWAAGGGLPAHTGVLQAMPQQAAPLPAGIAPVLGRAECYQQAFPNRANSDQLWKALHSAAHSAVAGTASPETAFERAAQEVRQNLRQEGALREGNVTPALDASCDIQEEKCRKIRAWVWS